MSKIQNQISQELQGYSPARLIEGKEWYIEYYVFHPSLKQLKRKRMKFNRIKSITERRKHAKKVILKINKKLADGWNPFVEDIAPKAFYKFDEVIKTFMTLKERNSRKATVKAYRSVFVKFTKWIDENQLNEGYVINFTGDDARRFVRNIESDYKLSAVSINNVIVFLKIFFNWMIDNGYVRDNPFSNVKKRKVDHKKRIQYVEPDTRSVILKYFNNHNTRMSLFIQLLYHCLIRPNELVQVRIKDVDFLKQTIKIDASIAKTKKTRFATIPNVLMQEIIKSVDSVSVNDFIFSKNEMLPGRDHIDTRRIGEKWSDMRQSVGLNNTYHLYSLRDTGIIQKLKDGISPDEVMYQAGHSSLKITNKYVRIANPRVYEQIKKKATAF